MIIPTKYKAKPTTKQVIGGDWVSGSYVFMDDNTNTCFRDKPLKERHCIVTYVPGDWDLGGWVWVDIKPETLCLFSDSLDKNSVNIAFGDIVRVTSRCGDIQESTVMFRDGCFGFDFGGEFQPLCYNDYEVEVIGNKFD